MVDRIPEIRGRRMVSRVPVIVGQAVPEAETLEINPDSARGDLFSDLGERQLSSPPGRRPLYDRLRRLPW